jgi:hypothetical protein
MKTKKTPATAPALIAFHGDKSVKKKYLERVRLHAKADEIRSGYYWENGMGCAVGCTIHSGEHAAYERELGIPMVLARLEDRLFEGMYRHGATAEAKAWPERFLKSIPVGADLSLVWAKFMVWLLDDETDGVVRFAKTESSRAAIQGVSALYRRWASGDKPAITDWESARKIAAAAYADAAYAYAYADAAYADAAYAAADAAYAAYAYAYAAAAYAAAYAADAARKKHYLKMADKLIELMEGAK